MKNIIQCLLDDYKVKDEDDYDILFFLTKKFVTHLHLR